MDIVKANTLEEALHLLENGYKAAAGCTNIFVDTRKKGALYEKLADISAVPELKGITETESEIILGANTTFAEITEYFRDGALFEAASMMGGPQIRNTATIGGNICDASPACDGGPALLALDAALEIASADGIKTIPVSEFFMGVRKTALKPGELLTKIILPKITDKSVFRKVGKRNAMAISVASLAAAKGSNGLKLAMGSVAARPIRLTCTESYIASGAPLCREELKAALEKDISPITDIRAAAEYRKAVSFNLLYSVLTEVFSYEL